LGTDGFDDYTFSLFKIASSANQGSAGLNSVISNRKQLPNYFLQADFPCLKNFI
jgi:hypothetical protein